MSAVIAAATPILYAGVMSCGIGYTLQVVCPERRGSDCGLPAVEPGICIFRPGRLDAPGAEAFRTELFGCVLVFAAVLLVQIPTEKLFHTA